MKAKVWTLFQGVFFSGSVTVFKKKSTNFTGNSKFVWLANSNVFSRLIEIDHKENVKIVQIQCI